MAKPMTANNYGKIDSAVSECVTSVAYETVADICSVIRICTIQIRTALITVIHVTLAGSDGIFFAKWCCHRHFMDAGKILDC